MTDRHILEEAVRRWGVTSQLNQTQEERGEAIAAINRFRRGRTADSELLAELGDVQLMLDQMRVVFGDEALDAARRASADKLREHLLFQSTPPRGGRLSAIKHVGSIDLATTVPRTGPAAPPRCVTSLH